MPGGTWEPPSGNGHLKKSHGLDLDSCHADGKTSQAVKLALIKQKYP